RQQALRRGRGGEDGERSLFSDLRRGGGGERRAGRQPRAREPGALRRGVGDPPPAPRRRGGPQAPLETGPREAPRGTPPASLVGLSPDEERRMLHAIGVGGFEDLLAAVPKQARLKQPLAIDGPLSEIELRRRLGESARANAADRAVSLLGGGVYDHYIPSAL